MDNKAFLNDFLEQNKKRKILVVIECNIDNDYRKSFINLFNDIDFSLKIYSSSEQLAKVIKKSKENIIVLLGINDILLQDIENDTRLFIFQSPSKELIHCNILNIHEIVHFNIQLDNFFLSDCHIKYQSLSNKLYVDTSKINGFGMFAKEDIKKDEVLFTLNGEIFNKDFFNNQNFYGEWNALEGDMFLVREHRTSYGFINHSRTPNCYINKNGMSIISHKFIKQSEEILLDYMDEPLPKDYINGFGKTYL